VKNRGLLHLSSPVAVKLQGLQNLLPPQWVRIHLLQLSSMRIIPCKMLILMKVALLIFFHKTYLLAVKKEKNLLIFSLIYIHVLANTLDLEKGKNLR